jgi:transposase
MTHRPAPTPPDGRAQGKTNREIKRCLIRYIARQLYRLLETQPALDAT